MNTPAADWLLLSEPDIGTLEPQFVQAALQSPRMSQGAMVQRLERSFAQRVGREHAVAVASGTLGTWLALRALGLGPGDEIIAPAHGWHQVAHAVTLAGARVVFADTDYWSGCLSASHAAARITPATKALIAGNVNGHPAAWRALRELADSHGLKLVEDSTEALDAVCRDQKVGSFGDVAVFDFSQPSALCCGEGGLLLTDDAALAAELRYLRSRVTADRHSVSVGSRIPLQAGLGEPAAALALAQLTRIDEILERRKAVEAFYIDQMQSFEGIKPPYRAPDVDEVQFIVQTLKDSSINVGAGAAIY